jgi:hypothetical protein
VVLGVDGVSDFNALHSRKHDAEVQLYAFDLVALGGEDLRPLPLSMRKANLARLLRGRPDGMFVAPFEAAGIGPDLFDAACRMGLEGLVSKRRDRRYSGGRSKDWIKVKNRSASGDDAGDGRGPDTNKTPGAQACRSSRERLRAARAWRAGPNRAAPSGPVIRPGGEARTNSARRLHGLRRRREVDEVDLALRGRLRPRLVLVAVDRRELDLGAHIAGALGVVMLDRSHVELCAYRHRSSPLLPGNRPARISAKLSPAMLDGLCIADRYLEAE